MTGMSGASKMSSMPQNCGVKGMHGNTEAKQQNVAKALSATENSKQQSMPKNCGMKGMHEPEKGNKIDTRA